MASSGESRPRRISWSRVAVLVLLIAAVVGAISVFNAQRMERMLVWVQNNKQAGSMLFLVGYTLGVVLMFPAIVMGMASGAVFGVTVGLLLAWAGTCIGQTITFVLGRYLLRDVVKTYLSRHFPKWTAIDRAMASEAWKLVTLLRLSPIAPWNVLNYALAVTAVPLPAYAVASGLAVLPYLALFAYFGSLARDMADVFSGEAAALDPTAQIAVAIGSGVLVLVAVWYTTHVSRRAVAEALRAHADQLPPELTSDAEVMELLMASTLADGERLPAQPADLEMAARGERGGGYQAVGVSAAEDEGLVGGRTGGSLRNGGREAVLSPSGSGNPVPVLREGPPPLFRAASGGAPSPPPAATKDARRPEGREGWRGGQARPSSAQAAIASGA